MRKLLTTLAALALVLTLALPAGAYQEKLNTAVFTIGSTTYTVNGVAHQMDVAPVIINGRTLLPIRYVAYGMGIPDKDIQYMSQGRVPGYAQDQEVDITQHVHQPPIANYDATYVIVYSYDDLSNARMMVQNDNMTPPHIGTDNLLDAQYGVPPQVINGRLMMPLRSVSDQMMGTSVTWNGNTRQVTVVAPVVSDAD